MLNPNPVVINYPVAYSPLMDQVKRNLSYQKKIDLALEAKDEWNKELTKSKKIATRLSTHKRAEYFYENGIDILHEDYLIELLDIIKNKDLGEFKSFCNRLHMNIDEEIEQTIEDNKESAYSDDYDRCGVKRSDFSYPFI